jgi:peptidoglycan/xylan/chitin deacetylase (PgdA/CDA1 family)
MTNNVLLSLTSLCLLNLCGELLAQDAQAGFHWPNGKKVAVSLSFDDGRPSQIDVGLPLLDKHGVKATFYVNARSLGRRLEGWKKAAASGHEIGNHTNSHPCTVNLPFSRKNALEDYTIPMMEKELDGNNTEIVRLLGVKPVTFAFPCGQKFIGRGVDVQSYVPLIAKRFLAGRGFRDEGANDPVRCDLAQIMGMESDGLTFDQMKGLVATTAAERGWLVLAGHEIGSPGRQTTQAAALEEFLRYAAAPSNGVWLDTVAAVARYVRAQRGGR